MKKFLSILVIFFITVHAFAQVSNVFKYQAVIRDDGGNVIINQSVSFQITLLSGSAEGDLVYQERHSATTNSFGLVNLEIGNGIPTEGDMELIDWAGGVFFLKIEMDANGGTNYQMMGTSQLLSVPYAIYATYTQNTDDADADPGNEMQNLEISGNTLAITDGNSITLPPNEDADANPVNELQVLDISNDTLSISDGNSIKLPSNEDADADSTNELQTLNIAGNELTISDGNSILIPSSGSQWISAGEHIYYSGGNVGIGSTMPDTKLQIQSDVSADPDKPLFEVINAAGDTVFAIYQGGVQINIDSGAKGNRGGFVVGALGSGKLERPEYMKVTTDSVRIYVDTSTNKGAKGGFAIGGMTSAGKQGGPEFLRVTPDSVRIYINENTAKGAKGGFAVGGLSSSGKSNPIKFLDFTPDNYFIGHEAGKNTVVNWGDTTGIYNSFIGYKSGYYNVSGRFNVFLGRNTGYGNTIGESNVFIGDEAGFFNSTGNGNVFIGDWAGRNNNHGSYNIFLGREAGRHNNLGEANIFIGEHAGYSNSSGVYNVCMGFYTGASISTGTDNVFLGNEAGLNNTEGGGNVFLGTYSGIYNTTGGGNVFLGQQSGIWNTTGEYNVFLGKESGFYNETGFENTFVGYASGYSNTTGFENTFIGRLAGVNNTEGDFNTAVGANSGFDNTTGEWNTFLGAESGSYHETGSYNTYVGGLAGYKNTSGAYNAMVGSEAGRKNTSGIGNVFIGAQAGYENLTGGFNVFIGPEAGYYEMGSHKLYIENSVADSTEAMIFGNFSTDDLRFNANVGINGDPSDTLALNIYGDAYASGSWLSASDKRWKKNVNNLEHSLAKINNIQGVSYEWKIDEYPDKKFSEGTQLGFIAQDLEEVFPEVVKTDENGYKSVDYAKLTPILVEAIKELSAEIEKLKAEQQRQHKDREVEIDEVSNVNKYPGLEHEIKRSNTVIRNSDNKKEFEREEPESTVIPRDQ